MTDQEIFKSMLEARRVDVRKTTRELFNASDITTAVAGALWGNPSLNEMSEEEDDHGD